MARILRKYSTLGMVIAPFSKMDEATRRQVGEEFELKAVIDLDQKIPNTMGALLKREFNPYYALTEKITLSGESSAMMDDIVRDYDLIWFHGIRIPNSLGRTVWPRSILDIDDLRSQIHEAVAKQPGDRIKRLKALRQAILWRRRERVLLNRFGIVTVCSEKDRNFLGDSDRIHVIPNGFEAPSREPARMPADPPRVGFIGTLCYEPNVEGIRWFIDHVWPLIKQVHGDARLRLAGMKTDDGIAETGPDIDGLGFVEDAGKEIESWSAFIVPIKVGGGTRIKIAEAFSRKSPVVSTSLGAYGYPLENGRECLLADSPRDFAAACVELMENRRRGDEIAEHAWRRFNSEWSWDAIAPKVTAAVEACLRHAAGGPAPNGSK